MKKILKMFFICSISSSMLVGCDNIVKESVSEKEVDYPIKLETIYNGKEVDLAVKTVRNFIRAKNDNGRIATMLYEQLEKSTNDRIYGDKQNISFSWKDTNVGETFTLTFSKDKDFNEQLFSYETKNNFVDEFGIFIPGETYFYKVVGSVTGQSQIDSFTTKDLPVRYISSSTVLNMRDIGGWTTTDGKKVKYGMLYRGGALDGSEHPQGENYILERGTSRLDDLSLKIFNDYLHIKGEIDLRGVEQDQHEIPSFGGTKDNMCQRLDSAVSALWNKPEDQNVKLAFKQYFTFLANKDNYPIYFHCNGGADRTGALAFVINGLLGVDYLDLAIDYELTSYSFAAGGIRKRADIIAEGDGNYTFDLTSDASPACEYCTKILLSSYGDDSNSLQVAIENYLTKSCGVTKQEIEKVKEIMLENSD